MIFHVEMQVNIPYDLDEQQVIQLKAREKEISQAYQQSGKWVYLWRIAGQYANISIFDVESPAELQEIMTSLPLFPFMTVTVKALCMHPSAIRPTEL
jgi:muconolactone D-isomerase